jgi:alpha-methylacyl-CoA racemase
MAEAPGHPHVAARSTFVEVAGVVQPGPAPRFGRTPPATPAPPPWPGQGGEAALAAWGVPSQEVARLRAAGAVA